MPIQIPVDQPPPLIPVSDEDDEQYVLKKITERQAQLQASRKRAPSGRGKARDLEDFESVLLEKERKLKEKKREIKAREEAISKDEFEREVSRLERLKENNELASKIGGQINALTSKAEKTFLKKRKGERNAYISEICKF